mmetsp:Transcript_25040/g.38848  ORF Transcript_25040/g.38848 Transcript_25040/m.38848 type:complete len:519 (+) Transcript_25040:941-2497(+)
MGIVTAVSVLLMDLFTFLLFHSQMVETPTSVVFLLILNRSLMIGLGSKYWIYGYMILYMIYALAFAFQIARNRFPFEDDVVLKSSGIEGFLADSKGVMKASSRQKKLELLSEKFKKASNPEVLLLILSIFYVVLMAVISTIEITGVYLSPFVLQGATEKKEFEYWVVAFLSILLVFSFFFLVGLFRISVRKAKRIEQFGAQSSVSMFKQVSFLSLLSFYEVFSFIACAIWSGIAFWITEEEYYLIYGVFGSATLILFARAFVYFALNDFDYFQDVEKLNKWVDKHNKKIDQFEIKKEEIQQALIDGTLLLPPAPPPKPVKPTKPIEEQVQEDNDGGQEMEELPPEEPPAPEVDPEEQARIQAELMQKLVEKEKEKKRLAEEERQKKYEENTALKAREEAERLEMEEQMRREEEDKKRRQEAAQAERKKRAEEVAAKQREADAKRRRDEAAKKNEASQDNTVYNYQGKMEAVDVVNTNKGYKDDEMYEGGEDADLVGNGEGTGPSIDPSKIYLDIDKTE